MGPNAKNREAMSTPKFKILDFIEVRSIQSRKPSLMQRLWLWMIGVPYVPKYWIQATMVVEKYDDHHHGDMVMISIPEMTPSTTHWMVMAKGGVFKVGRENTFGCVRISNIEPYSMPVLPERKLTVEYGYTIASAHVKEPSGLEKNGYSFEIGC